MLGIYYFLSSLFSSHTFFKDQVLILHLIIVWQAIMKGWEGENESTQEGRKMWENVWWRGKMNSWVFFGQERSKLRRKLISLIHFDFICRHLQRKQDQMAKWRLLTSLIVFRSNFEFWEAADILYSIKFILLLINIFPGLSSKLYCYDLVIFSFQYFKEIKEPDVA